MLTSMTGFGRSVRKTSFGRITVEIQSVNRKHLELLVSLPKEFIPYELELRKAVSERMGRGQVTLRVYLLSDQEMFRRMLPDAALLRELKVAWVQLARECGYAEEGIDLPFLLQMVSSLPQNGASEWKEEELQIVKECVIEAMEAAIEMKRQEERFYRAI